MQQKIVYLIQKWGLRFESQHDRLPLFFDVYSALLKTGVQFPPPPSPVQTSPAKPEPKPAPSGGVPSLDRIPKKYHKLIGDMNLVKGNINLTNEIIDSIPPGERDNETLNDLFSTLQQMEPKLFNLISQIECEEVLQVTLLVNDDLQKTFKRYHAVKDGRKPERFMPGESSKNTLLNPTHVYTIASSETKPAPVAPKEDLFDFMGASKAPSQ